MGGASYVVAVYLAISNATFFRIVRVGRSCYVPLGIVAPLFIQVGVIGSSAIRPLVGDAKEAAMAQDVIGAFVILGVYAAMALWFRTLAKRESLLTVPLKGRLASPDVAP